MAAAESLEETEVLSSEGKGMSAEAKREARRNRILQNREERLQRILGPNSGSAARKIVASTPPADDDEPVLPEEFLTQDFLQKAKAKNSSSSNPSNFSRTGSTLPLWQNYHLYLILIGTLLPFVCNSYFLIYFALFEVGVYTFHRRIPGPPSSTNIIFTLILVMGLKEQDVNRIKLLVRFCSWIFKDICIFMLSGILPQVTIHLFRQGQKHYYI